MMAFHHRLFYVTPDYKSGVTNRMPLKRRLAQIFSDYFLYLICENLRQSAFQNHCHGVTFRKKISRETVSPDRLSTATGLRL